jgi:hypothetical protein
MVSSFSSGSHLKLMKFTFQKYKKKKKKSIQFLFIFLTNIRESQCGLTLFLKLKE